MNYLQAHENAVSCARDFRNDEARLIAAIQDVIKTRAWTYFTKYATLHAYIVGELKLSEDQAYQFSRIAGKAMQVPELDEAIQKGTLNLSNARRILKVMTPETKVEWIEKASHMKQRELEKEVVKVNPTAAVKERIKPIAEDVYELRAAIPKDVEEMIARVKDIESQRTRKNAGLVDVLRQTCLAYLKAHDPLLKAKRNLGKPQTKVFVSRQIPASVTHEVRNRDFGQCTYPGCANRRWLDVHHIKPVSEGGLNTVENLTTLCGFHHRSHHRVTG